MARFMGTVNGTRGEASRLGTDKSGLTTVAASWSGSVRVYLYVRHGEGYGEGEDWADVYLEPWHGAGVSRLLFSGAVDGSSGRFGSFPPLPMSPVAGEEDSVE